MGEYDGYKRRLDQAPLAKTGSGRAPGPGPANAASSLLSLQRSLGNAAVVQLIETQNFSPGIGHDGDLLQRNCKKGHKGQPKTTPAPKPTGRAAKAPKPKSAEQLAREAAAEEARKQAAIAAHSTAVKDAVEAAEGDAALADSEQSLQAAVRANTELLGLSPVKQVRETAAARIARATTAVTAKRTAKAEADLSTTNANSVIAKAGAMAVAVVNSERAVTGASLAEDSAINALDSAAAEVAKAEADTSIATLQRIQGKVDVAVGQLPPLLDAATTHCANSTAAFRYGENNDLGALALRATAALETARQIKAQVDAAVSLGATYQTGAVAAVAHKKAAEAKQAAAQHAKAAAGAVAARDAAAAASAAHDLAEAKKELGAAQAGLDTLDKDFAKIDAEYLAAKDKATKSAEYAKLITKAAGGDLGIASDSASEFVDLALADEADTAAAAEELAAPHKEASERRAAGQDKVAQKTAATDAAQKSADTTKGTAAASRAQLNNAERELNRANGMVLHSADFLKSEKARREKKRLAAGAAGATAVASEPEESDSGLFFRGVEIQKLAPVHGEALIAFVGAKLLDELQSLLERPIAAAQQAYILPLLGECGKNRAGIEGARELIELAGDNPQYLDLVVKHGKFSELAKLKLLLGLPGMTARILAFYLDPAKGGQVPTNLHADLSAGHKVWCGEQAVGAPAYLPAGTTLATIVGDSAPSIHGAAPTGGKTYAGNRTFKNLGGADTMRLPMTQTYTEYDIKPFEAGNRGANRIVVDGRGWKYLTTNHYDTLLRFDPSPAIAP